MDREAIQTSVRYMELREQHFNGGYYSEAVRAQIEKFKTLSEEDKQAFFRYAFNDVYDLVEQLQSHPRFDKRDNGIDLTNEGLGFIALDTCSSSADDVDFEGDCPYKGVMVRPEAFDPVPVRSEQWINAPGDYLGLETAGPTMVTEEDTPRFWNEDIFANLDGSFNSENDRLDIDNEMLRLLDAKETLDEVHSALAISQQIPA